MPNRLLTVRYKSQEYLIHLYYTEETTEIKFFDTGAKNDFSTTSFAVNRDGELITVEDHVGNTQALWDLYEQVLQQHKELICLQ